jgi:sugar diacid utilization regulator
MNAALGSAEKVVGYEANGGFLTATDFTLAGELPALPTRDALLVPRDERTLFGWLHVADAEHMDDWIGVAKGVVDSRIAFGEMAEGIDGFRLSHVQARSTGAVINASRRKENPTVVRYRDVAALTFLVDRPTESRGWVNQVLGDLAAPGQERERLRDTLQVFLDEGENALTTGERLFIHRNTVKYRVDRALALLPEPRRFHRLDVALALKYVDWVGASQLESDALKR